MTYKKCQICKQEKDDISKQSVELENGIWEIYMCFDCYVIMINEEDTEQKEFFDRLEDMGI